MIFLMGSIYTKQGILLGCLLILRARADAILCNNWQGILCVNTGIKYPQMICGFTSTLNPHCGQKRQVYFVTVQVKIGNLLKLKI